MATKASGTLVLVIEKQHASWGLMCSTLPALELRFRRQPHIASARPLVGPSGPCTVSDFIHTIPEDRACDPTGGAPAVM